MNTRIPESWIVSTFGELNQFSSRTLDPAQTPDEKFELYSVPSFPTRTPEYLRGVDIGSTKQLVEPNDVLVCKINPRINRVWLVGFAEQFRQIASSEWIGFRSDFLNSKFYRYYFTSSDFRELICADVTGVGGSLTRAQPKNVATFPIPIVPCNEQKRIADKLDAVLARVDACRERLDRVPAILKRFRQSVLAAATSGKLTEDWRAARVARMEPQAESGNVACDTAQLRYSISAKSNFITPHQTNEAIVNKLPETWVIRKIKDAGRIQLGRQRSPKFHSGENMRPYLRVQNVFEDHIDLSDVMEMSFPGADLERYQLHYGDILLNEGQSPEFLGRPAMYRGELPGVCFTNTLIRFQAYPHVIPDFALLVFRHHMHSGRYRVEGNITTNIAHLGAGRFAEVEFPLPPMEEQTEIVRRVESLFAYADRLEARYTTARAQVDKLTPATLAKAFRGELVPQDPNDEPASALLARIAAARAAASPSPTPRKKKRPPKETV